MQSSFALAHFKPSRFDRAGVILHGLTDWKSGIDHGFLYDGTTYTPIEAPNSVVVVSDGSNRFLSVPLTGAGADLLVNLAFEAETVAVDFLSVALGEVGLLDTYSTEQNPISIDFSSFVGEDIVANGPGTTSVTAPLKDVAGTAAQRLLAIKLPAGHGFDRDIGEQIRAHVTSPAVDLTERKGFDAGAARLSNPGLNEPG